MKKKAISHQTRREESSPDKRPYRKPQLQRYGRIQQLTGGLSGPGFDLDPTFKRRPD